MTIHRYQLIRELGRGGMGSVFLARDTRLGRLAAIKFLTLRRPTLVQRFIAEARATALCNHENIVVIYDADEYRGMPYMALEYLEGRTLQQLLKDEEVARPDSAQADDASGVGTLLSAERAVQIAIPILRALHRAHEMGIVHRDLKPANVMLTNSGTVKVLDFGIAKVLDRGMAEPDEGDQEHHDSDASAVFSSLGNSAADGHGVRAQDSMTRTGSLMGTLPYMSPEQMRARSVDGRADIWALGIMLFQMVTGRHPLAPLSKSRLMQIADFSIPMPRLSALRPDLGPLARIIDSCLLKQMAERTANARQLLRELQPFNNARSDAFLGVDESPFAGLAAFQESDAGRFFGRSEDIAAVVARVRSQPMVAVMGPSGVGKSSLVRAGVIPTLKQSGEGWESLIVRPGRSPLISLADLLAQFLLRSSTSQSLEQSMEPVSDADSDPGHGGYPSDSQSTNLSDLGDPSSTEVRGTVKNRLREEPGYLGAALRAWATHKVRRIVVFVDQFEELFTLDVDPDERAGFLNCLVGVADDASSPLRVIFSMRSDFIERLAEVREFMSVATRGLVLLPPISRRGLRAALVKPVAAARYRFEDDDIVDGILDALENTHGALPLLQFTAASLWEARDRSRRLLTRDSYRAMGGIAGTLARHADAVLAGMSAKRVLLTRRIFERLVTPERTRAIASVSELRELADTAPRGAADTVRPKDIDRVLQELADARLLVIETSATGEVGGTVEIVHESLIAGWPTLNQWLDENHEDAAFVARLRAAAIQWEKSGGSPGMLWRGDIEHEARRFFKRYQGSLAEREWRFLNAVFALADRAKRRKRMLIVGVIVGLSAMVLAALAGLWTIGKAEREASRQAAIARQQVDELEREKAAKQAALQQAEAAQGAVKMTYAELQAALQKESEARAQADSDRALAEKALREVRATKDKLEKALEREQRRLEKLSRATKDMIKNNKLR